MRRRRYFPAAHGRADIHAAAHGGPYAGAGGCLLKELQPMERTHAGAEEKCEEEGAPERDCYVLNIAPYPPSLLHKWRGRGVEEESGVKE